MDEQQKEQLVEQFRTYLETEWIPDEPGEIVDQTTLFTELAGLKTEVKIESRQVKGALDDFRSAFASLDQTRQDTATLLEHITRQEREAAQSAFKPVIDDLIELFDRIEAGLAIKPPKPSFWERVFIDQRQNSIWLESYLKGQEITLARLVDILGRCGVSPIDVTNQRFAPHCMKAVDMQSDPARENGVVLEETRRGFLLGDRVLRPAEVIVNRREDQHV